MYRLAGWKKRDPERRWGLPDRVFFACGACHILAHAFLERYDPPGARVVWLRPDPGFTGNHIVVTAGVWAFDYHSYTCWTRLLAHTRRKAARWWPGWDATPIELPREVLVSERLSRRYDGLHLREPLQFLHDALPRARTYLDRFPPPPPPGGT
jgi:hypothetical protein